MTKRLYLIPLLFCVSIVVGSFYPIGTAQAHGGVIIDSGATELYEWLVAVSPYPVAAGETVITLLVYDVETYAPIDGLTAELYLASPGSPQPCCTAEHHIGPVLLQAQPALYPGDYSATVPLNQMGDWQMQFRVAGADAELKLVVPVEVGPPGTANAAAVLAGSPDAAATATVFAQNVAEARQSIGASSGRTGGFTIPLLGDNLWLWGLVALIPIIMIAFGLLNLHQNDAWDEDEKEDNEEEAQEAMDVKEMLDD